jgi:two-component system, response regulator PdtaR
LLVEMALLSERDDSELAGVRVLIVEDTWHVAKALKGLLEGLGMQVIGPAATVAEAEEHAAARMPELALIDINLKGEMAYGLIDHLHDGGIPIIVVSGYAVLGSLNEKAAAILQKPYKAPELIAALHGVVGSTR